MATTISILAVILDIVILFLILRNNSDKANNDVKSQLLIISDKQTGFEKTLRDEISQIRTETNNTIKDNRNETSNTLRIFNENLINQVKNMGDGTKNLMDTFSEQLKNLIDTNSNSMSSLSRMQKEQLINFSEQLSKLNDTTEQRLNEMRKTIEEKLTSIQKDNSEKLEKMRATVDEKLHDTLETRLGESFKTVTDKLQSLYKELGEVQNLSDGVNDLRKALTNVKTRGTWGEIALGNIIEDILTVDQYSTNISTKKGSKDRVEYAIKLPGQDDNGSAIYLPVDAKFPQSDYQNLLDAEEHGNLDNITLYKKQLEQRIKDEAKDICGKYLDPPNTTDFGIMFLPTESLYAEVLKIPGLLDCVQQNYRVTITGPTTLSAFLNSLQMGFKTLAIQKKTSEVWKLLGAIKTNMDKLGDILEKTLKKLLEASNSIETASKRSNTIKKKLKDVEQLPENDSDLLLSESADNDAETDAAVS